MSVAWQPTSLNAWKDRTMRKIKIIVDSPSDIPDNDLIRYDIEMVSVPIQMDGISYMERQSFSCLEFYTLLEQAKELPTTSRVPIHAFQDAYIAAWKAGFTDAVVITMNAGGSATHESAQVAAIAFYDDMPEAMGNFSIHIVDSMTYSMAYGYPAVQAAAMAQEGAAVETILAYLQDFFRRVRISLVCYTLDYAKRSGRITAAAAIAGGLLGIRPIIAMVDGSTKITSKARGNNKATKKLVDTYREQRVSPDDLVLIVSGATEEYGQAMEEQLENELLRSIPHYKAGAAIAINAGPQMAALCYLGKKRKRDEIRQPSVISFDGVSHAADAAANQ